MDLQLHVDTLEPPFRWMLKQMDLLTNLNDVLCLLWMPHQTELLLHMGTIRILCFVHYGCLNRLTCCCTWTMLGFYVHHGCLNRCTCCCIQTLIRFYVLFAIDASTDGLVVAHGHCCCVYAPDFKNIDELYYICVVDARRRYGVKFH